MKSTQFNIALAMGLTFGLGLTACIDHDYDLSKDIDMTVQVGSDGFILPASDTAPVTLSQILNLDNDSSIKTAKEGEYGLSEGDYVLVQTGSADASEVRIDKVQLDQLSGTSSTTNINEFMGTGLGRVSMYVEATPTTIEISDDNVTRELVSLESADLDVSLSITLHLTSNDFTGAAIIEKGFKAVFDPSWTLEITDPATEAYLKMEDDHTAVFIADKQLSVGQDLDVQLHLSKVDFTKLSGQGLIAPGKFKLDSSIKVSGSVAIDEGNLALGQKANLSLVTTTAPTFARLISVTGIVDPKINVNSTRININDIPDFLSDKGNVLDIENPRVSFTVYNSSPVALNLNATLTAVDNDGSRREVGIGDAHSTAAITIQPETTSEFVISRKALSTGSAVNVVVPDLGDLIKTIPDYIEFANVEVKALPRVITMVLGSVYNYTCDYEAVVPLAFGADMKLNYTHEETDWDQDLDKYNFNEVHVSANVVNSLPLNFVPAVEALDRNGQTINDITVTVEGNVAAGDQHTPTTSPLKIILRSEAENIGRLDGVRLFFTGSADASHAGINLNKTQSMEFNDIKIQIIGGVTVDLND